MDAETKSSSSEEANSVTSTTCTNANEASSWASLKTSKTFDYGWTQPWIKGSSIRTTRSSLSMVYSLV
ncbi:hypothetical protein [Diadegma fenestrale ichnovirus]|nr:hypothetical protein [Diadegma fenestrale ichnovirus]